MLTETIAAQANHVIIALDPSPHCIQEASIVTTTLFCSINIITISDTSASFWYLYKYRYNMKTLYHSY